MLAKRHITWIVFIAGGAIAALLATKVRTASPDGAASGDRYAHAKQIDPVEANGAIFVDWPKPDVVLVFSGEQDGYLEPCGCAGLENQKGGLKRRATLLKDLRAKGWPVIAMDLGGQEKRSGVQAEIKLDFSLRALAKMDYAAVGFGLQDLRMDLLQTVLNLDQPDKLLVCANVGVGSFDSGLSQRYKVVEAGGMKIGITTVVGKKAIEALRNSADIAVRHPEEALREAIVKLREARCDQLVLLSHAEPEETKELARLFPEFNWVATAHGAEVPPDGPAKIEGAKSQLIEVGHKGMYVVAIGLYKNASPPWRYQRVPLDHRFADAPEIHQMHVAYQHQLKQLVEQSGWSALGLKPVAHPSGRKFAGSNVCAECHSNATEVYEKTPHFHGTDTLVNTKLVDPPRQFDPECLSCHATGWEPQKYFPFESGFLGTTETPHLVGNGCENCHGPAARHVAAEKGDIEITDDEQEMLRAALRLKIVENEGNKEGQEFEKGKVVQMCMQCHDLDNSPDFDFQEYWPKVEHKGKD